MPGSTRDKIPAPALPRSPRLKQDLPSLPRFDRWRPSHALSSAPPGSPSSFVGKLSMVHESRTTTQSTPIKGRRLSHGQQVQGHSAGNHHVRQPSPVPSSASSSGDSEGEGDERHQHPRRTSAGLGHHATSAEGTRWRTGRRKAHRSSQAAEKLAMTDVRMIDSSSAPGGESDTFGGTITEEVWTPSIELPPDVSSSSRTGWSWAVPDFAQSRRPSPAQPPVGLPDADTFAQLVDANVVLRTGSNVHVSPSPGDTSPTMPLNEVAGPSAPSSAAVGPSTARHRISSTQPSALAPPARQARSPLSAPVFPLYLGSGVWSWKITRTWTHSALVVAALAGASCDVWKEGEQEDRYCVLEIGLVAIVSCAYVLFRPFRLPIKNRPPSPDLSRARSGSPTSHQLGASSAVTEERWSGLKGYIWGTDERNYRDCPDDGVITGLLFGPLLSASLLLTTLRQRRVTTLASPLPVEWLVESPLTLAPSETPEERTRLALDALTKSRRSLLSLSTVVTLVVLFQLILSRRAEIAAVFRAEPARAPASKLSKSHYGRLKDSEKERGKERERWWVPKSEWRRTAWVVGLAFGVTAALGCLKALFGYWNTTLWRDLSTVDVVVASLYHQFSMYVCVRLARKGFTLGELGIVSQFSTALFMEVVNLTRARISLRFLTTSYVQTYRLPTPLLIYQLALMPGSFLVGFLLSPILYLSRYISQKPSHRLRFPEEKNRHRRFLALGFYLGTLLIVGGVVGFWSKWQLDWRDPWVWIVLWILEGSHWWSRPALLAYWGALASISVAGWELQLAKARHKRPWALVGPPGRDTVPSVAATPRPAVRLAQAGATASTPAGLDAGTPFSPNTALARVPILSLNGRRKFFHGLAILMFIPGIYFDPAFSHIAFSVAFAIFVFAEYVRYFALYPFGVMVHLFLNEFIDHKDSGTAILSHFYLLTGCALGLWLESPSPLLSYVGILTLGVGDALASIVGQRFGRKRWSTSSGKTVEGSIAFVFSMVLSVVAMAVVGVVPHVSPGKLVVTALASALLEAVSNQNDNLEIPLYTWTLMSILGI